MCGIYVIVIWRRVLSILWLLAFAMLLAASVSNSLINAALLALLRRLLRTCVDFGEDEKRQPMLEWVMDGEDGEREKERRKMIQGIWISECVSLKEWFDVCHLL